VPTYRYRVNGGDWESVRQVVTLDWTPCHYGGGSPGSGARECHRRVMVLCQGGKWFLCRHCYELPYGSQQEIEEARLLRKVRKLRESLVPHEPLGTRLAWNKPQDALAHL
jgi:hypothetical protein